MSTGNAFLRAVRQHRLIPPDSVVVVAVSGGADSLMLLHLLVTHQAALECRLHVATLDHGLRGEVGAADARFVVALARSWNLDVTADTADVRALAASSGAGIEAAARRARYDFLARVARAVGSDRIATAHHADDQAETVLMHLLRGAGIAGIAGMGYQSGVPFHDDLTLIRPLLEISRADIETYCQRHDLIARQDTTNEDVTYTRNWLRHDVLPMLAAQYPQVRRALVTMADVAAVEDDYVQQQFSSHVLPAVDAGDCRVRLPRVLFVALHPALQRRFVRWAAGRLGATDDLAYDHVVAAVDVMRSGRVGAIAELPGRVRLRLDYDVIVVETENALAEPPGEAFMLVEDNEAHAAVAIAVPSTLELGQGWRLHAAREMPPEPPVNAVVLALQPDDRIVLRGRQPGDAIAIQLGDGKLHRQKVAHWMIDHKVPQAIRNRVPLIVVNDEVAAIVYGEKPKISARFMTQKINHSLSIVIWLENTNE